MSEPCPVRASKATANPSGGSLSDRREPSDTLACEPRARRNRVLRGAAHALGIVVLGGALGFGALLYLTPPASEAVALVRAQAAKHRTAYPGPTPPPLFVKALLATEDHRFYSLLDPGIDPFAVGRVALGQILAWGDQGGSTIAQQLAKMLYTHRHRGVGVKLERVALAVKLDFTYTKPEILAMYAEIVYFGNGYYGLEKASCGYFGKQPAKLNLAQAAMLAGVVNAPSLDNPRTHPAAAKARQTHVFARLVAVGEITEAQAKDALSQPLGLVPAGHRGVRSSCLGSGSRRR